MILLLIFPFQFYAQVPDTIQNANIEFITDQLETIAEKTDLNLDYSDLVDDFLYYSKNKIDLNSPEASKLMDLRVISQSQLNSLQEYISVNGPLFSVFELASIPGYDETTIQQMLPFVTISSSSQRTKI